VGILYRPYFKWVAARLLIVAANVAVAISMPVERSNIDWPACFLVSSISAAALFAWLTAIRYKQGIDWSEPYSWRKPFWPMRKYPSRYWFIISMALIIAGAVGMARLGLFHQGHEAVLGTFLFMGLFMLIILTIFIGRLEHAV
jgi:hypothetical protein